MVAELHEDPHDAAHLDPVQHVGDQEVPLPVLQLLDCAVRFRPFAEDRVRPDEINPALAKLGFGAAAERGKMFRLVVLGAERDIPCAKTVHYRLPVSV
jgi:hypothetical protein